MSEHYEQLILKSLSGTATDEEQLQLKEWTALSPENKKLSDDYQEIWNVESSVDIPDFNTASELSKLKSTLDGGEEKIKTFSISRSLFLKVAASITLLMVCFILIYQHVNKSEMIVMKSGAERIQLALPDGSEVWLNENSKITYASDFDNGDRYVELVGEAFFEVKKNLKKPFIVNASGSQVKVLGTSFNIRAYEEESQEEVVVVTGKVSFSVINNPDELVVLNPGEHGVFDKGNNALLQSSPDSNLLAWKTKQLIFKKTNLVDVAKTLEKYFRISISVKNLELKKCRFTSSFENPTLDEVIEAISIAFDLDIIHQDKNYTFEGTGCVN